MKRTTALISAAALIAVSSVAAVALAQPHDDRRGPPAPPREKATVEVLYGATFDPRGLTLRVNSNGCTKKEDFAVRVQRQGKDQTLLVARTRSDRCRALVRGGVDLTWSLQELGLDRSRDVRVLNRFAVW
jgi:hypothetical protein